jgi:anti-sigma factor RsiW
MSGVPCRDRFDDLLAAHPELQAEVAAFESTANLLALAPQEQDPPPSSVATS